VAEIDSNINTITNQERERMVKNLQELNDSLNGRTSLTDALPPLPKSKNKGRPVSTKRDASHFEAVDEVDEKGTC
jgi:hypothetical protein